MEYEMNVMQLWNTYAIVIDHDWRDQGGMENECLKRNETTLLIFITL